MFNRRIIFSIIWVLTSFSLYAQQEALKPVFPKGSTGLIYIEGEDAVSTNFANQPVSNFGCSGYQAVQLNRNTGLQGGVAFYADFVFYVEEAGTYEFWYSGTPPGPADDLIPSYSSPFRYILDEGEPVSVYREDMHVIEGYTPSYYWNSINTVELSEGSHTFRIEVAEKRGYDGRYYFYLDSLFFLNREKIDEIDAVKPAVFPGSLDNTVIDNPFLSITDYEGYIEEHPDEVSAYIELSLVYSLLGDYQGALKTLNRAMAIDASNPYPIVLAAKNRLWKGDVRESLSLYERALSVNPDEQVLWAEAGKVAAWTGEYDKSIDFFTRGLELFPGNLNMQVNLGLTYLWMSKSEEAKKVLENALKGASGDPEKLSELGWTEQVNGYPGYAQDVYKKSIELYPAYLEFYLLLQSSYLDTGDREAADDIGKQIESVFRSSPQLQNVLEIYRKKLYLIDEIISSYLEKLKADPGNLELRKELAQTFFWNGMSREAVEQIRYVITTHGYNAAGTYVRRNSDLLELLDRLTASVPLFGAYPAAASSVRQKIESASAAAVKAEKELEKIGASSESTPEQKAAARKLLSTSQQELADSVSEARYLLSEIDSAKSDLKEYETAVKTFLENEKEENEAFNKVVSSSGWSWDMDWQVNELRDVMKDERELASYMLGRVLISEKSYEAASDVLSPEPEEQNIIIETAEDAASEEARLDAPAVLDYSGMSVDKLYSLYQALLFDGNNEPLNSFYAAAGSRLSEDYPHTVKVNAVLQSADNLAGGAAPGVYFKGIEADAAEVLKSLGDYADEAAAEKDRARQMANQVAAIAAKRLERANYYLEADTYLIRYELGTYYLDDGQNLKASEQFRRVVAIDPWNISAAYKLGIVEQRYGNWSEAMKYYKKVYQQDPGYENAVYYYNQLARAHADRLGSSFQLNNTPSEIAMSAGLSYSTEFNSFLGFGFNYSLDQQRLYREYSGEEKGSFQVHVLEASLPVSLGKTGLVIKPHAGLYTESIFYKRDMYFPANDSVSFTEFLKTMSSYPKYGVSAGWKYEFLTLDVSWDRAVEADTFYDDRTLTGKHDLQLNANTWFEFEQDLLGPLTTRTYGRLQFMDDANKKWQIFQDVMLGFNVASKPIIRLSPSASFNYESSSVSPGDGYYAPDNVIEAKGDLRAAFTFPSSDWSSAFEAVLWGGSGGYWTALGSGAPGSSLKAEGGLGLTFVKNSNTYYLNLASLGTFAEGENEYWEFSVQLGSSLNLPGLLTQ